MWFICDERPFRDDEERVKWSRRRWKNQLAIVSILANHRSHNQSIILWKQTAQHSIDVYKLFDKIILNDFISAIYFGIFPCERTVPIFCLGSFLLLLLFLLCKHNIFHFSYRVDVCKIMHWTLAVFDSVHIYINWFVFLFYVWLPLFSSAMLLCLYQVQLKFIKILVYTNTRMAWHESPCLCLCIYFVSVRFSVRVSSVQHLSSCNGLFIRKITMFIVCVFSSLLLLLLIHSFINCSAINYKIPDWKLKWNRIQKNALINLNRIWGRN